MTNLQSEVFEALRAIDIPEAMALKAATALSRRDEDVADLKSDMRLLKWMVGSSIGLALLMLSAMIAGTITISIRLGEIAGQVTQLAQRIH